MTAVTVEYVVSFGKRSEQPRKSHPTKAEIRDRSIPAPKIEPSATKTARLLALAHYVERAVNSGLLKDYAAAARLLGMTRARMAQVMNLLWLSPGIQEAILAGKLVRRERPLRSVVRHIDWNDQKTAVSNLN